MVRPATCLSTLLAYVVIDDEINGAGTIDTASRAVIANITVGKFPSSVAFSPDGTFAYVTNEGSDTVSVINAAFRVVSVIINVDKEPNDVTFSPDGTSAYVTHYQSNNVSVINTAFHNVTYNIRTTYAVAFSPNGKFAYVTNFYGGFVSVINTTSSIVTAKLLMVGILSRAWPSARALSSNVKKQYISSNIPTF